MIAPCLFRVCVSIRICICMRVCVGVFGVFAVALLLNYSHPHERFSAFTLQTIETKLYARVTIGNWQKI